jgi:molecular chaperone DnaJ
MSSTVPRDPYEVLGVPRDADETQIKKAFRRLARELHPDVNAHDPQAEEKFKQAAEAYEILNDPERRALYDRYGHEGLRSGGYAPNFEGFGSIADIFEAFFGETFGGGRTGPGRGPRQGADVAVTAEITLEEAYAGGSVQLSFEAVEVCERCSGNGAEPGTPIQTCERCGGNGVLQAVSRSVFGQVVRTVPCDTCHGEGKVASSPCKRCDGRGREVRRRSLEVDVPAGISDGQRIRLTGRGHAGEGGGPPGDLYVLIQVRPDPRFIRDGHDLVTVLDVSAPLAAVGARLPVETLDGTVDVDVPAGTQPGEIITLAGKGMPVLQRRGRYGDLRAVVNVVVPRKLSRHQRKLAQQLAESLEPENLRSDDSLVDKLRRLLRHP